MRPKRRPHDERDGDSPSAFGPAIRGVGHAPRGVQSSILAPCAAVIADAPSVIVFSGPGIVIACLAAFLASRFGTWAKIASLVVGLLLLLAAVAFGQLGLVASVFDFVPGLAAVLCGLLMMIGSLTAMRARVGGQRSSTAGNRPCSAAP